MIELIQNMDWVLKVTLGLWLIVFLLQIGLGAILSVIVLAISALHPVTGIIMGVISAIAYWLLLVGRWVFLIWSCFILLGYLF